jgi:hypothetical protein
MRFFLLMALFSGCVTTTTLRNNQMEKLDGYDVATEPASGRVLETASGAKVAYGKGRELEIHLIDGHEVTGQLEKLSVDTRLGLLRGTLTSGTAFSFLPSEVASLRVNAVSPWKTVLLVACILTAGLGAAAGITVIAWTSHGFGFGFQ